jgi:hypothetical protein
MKMNYIQFGPYPTDSTDGTATSTAFVTAKTITGRPAVFLVTNMSTAVALSYQNTVYISGSTNAMPYVLTTAQTVAISPTSTGYSVLDQNLVVPFATSIVAIASASTTPGAWKLDVCSY